MRCSALCLVVALLFLTPVALPAAAGQSTPTHTGPVVDSTTTLEDGVGDDPTAVAEANGTVPPVVASQVETRQTLFRVSMTRDGDAQWTVTTLYELNDGAEREAFEEFVAAYRTGDVAIGPNATTWRRSAASAGAATGRPMTVENVSRDGGLRNQTTGALVLRFRWTNFAQEVDEDTFRVRDVFQRGVNTWLPRIDADQTLIVETVADAQITSTNYPLTEFKIRVVGPQDLTAEPVDVTYTLEPITTPPSTPPSTQPPTTTRPTITTLSPTPAPPGQTSDVIAFGAVVAALAAVVVAFVVSRGGVAGVDTTDDGEVVADTASADTGADSTDTDADGDGATATEPTADTDESSVTSDSDTDTEPEPDPELLSDEERVERLLEQNGGRMRQADIVSETGWSDAKVSQLLSAMAEDGRVDKLRLGRENLISFPDVDGAGDQE
ncbi:MAG: hypothetical protein J07HB67_01239 [halophilic archaeon J07HB67]|jgi:Uncharacterized membrane-associated protein/domain|nr:MAG: hypothetical protein J07HB67_01239 [halophilic archaeon J07HB67]